MCSCNGEPSVWDEVVVTARKPHRCEECRYGIAPGEPYVRVGARHDDSWSAYRFCLFCLAFTREAQREWRGDRARGRQAVAYRGAAARPPEPCGWCGGSGSVRLCGDPYISAGGTLVRCCACRPTLGQRAGEAVGVAIGYAAAPLVAAWAWAVEGWAGGVGKGRR